MAFTRQQLRDFYLTMLQSASLADRAQLGETATPLITEVMGEVISSQRGTSMITAVTPIVSVSVSNWAMAKALADVADGATYPEMLSRCEQPFYEQDAGAFAAPLLAQWFSARKLHNVPPYSPPAPPPE